MKLQEFYDLLEQHDWYYDYSDDFSIYSCGLENYKNLQRLSLLSKQHEELFVAYRKHKSTGKPWGTKQLPKPKRPE